MKERRIAGSESLQIVTLLLPTKIEQEMVSARPRRDNTLFGNGQGDVRPQFYSVLVCILSNQPKKAVLFVGYTGGEVNAGAQRKKVPQAIKLERCAIGSRERLDKR